MQLEARSAFGCAFFGPLRLWLRGSLRRKEEEFGHIFSRP
jgi:hypothetical protein